MNRMASLVLVSFLGVTLSNAAVAQENRTFNGTQVRNDTDQLIDVVIVGRQNGIIDRNYRLAPGQTRATEDGYLRGGWRAVCWWNSATKAGLGAKMEVVERDNQVIAVSDRQKIFLLPAYSCSGSDHGNAGTIQARKNNREMITFAFLSHVPESGLVVYGDRDWPDETNASNREFGYGKSDLQRALEGCPARSTDTIVLYWNGHGGGPEHQFAMYDGVTVLRSTVMDWIKARKTRLSVLLTDTCAKSVVIRAPEAAAAPGRPAAIAPLFDELFRKPQGVVDINSARPGEYAFRRNPQGSLFTMVFASQFPLAGLPNEQIGYLHANAGNRKGWDVVLTEAQASLTAFFQSTFPNGSSGQNDQHIWRRSLPELPGHRARRYRHCQVQNSLGVPLDVVIVGQGQGVLDRNVNIKPGETRETSGSYLYGGWRVVAWWKTDDSAHTGVDTKMIEITHDGQMVRIP